MAVFKSKQLTIAEEARPNSIKRDTASKVRTHIFTTPDITGLVANDTIRLGTFRKGERLLGMKFACAANWLAATATIDLGVTGAEAKYLAAGVVGAAAVELDAGHTVALKYGEVLAADIELVLKVETAGAGTAPTAEAFVVVQYTR